MSRPAGISAPARVALGVTAAILGLVIGLAVVNLARNGDQPRRYRPFLAGMRSTVEQSIREGGPVFYSDPLGGSKAFYLDIELGRIVAYHVIPAGAGRQCPVEWDREKKQYRRCEGETIHTAFLPRFPVTTEPRGDGDEAVYVDLRRLEPAPGIARPLRRRS